MQPRGETPLEPTAGTAARRPTELILAVQFGDLSACATNGDAGDTIILALERYVRFGS